MDYYRTKAENTKRQRRAKGFYATAAHLAAGRKLINQGVAALTAEELETMSTHPFFRSQSEYFAALAAALA
jgi:hypothetical protein